MPRDDNEVVRLTIAQVREIAAMGYEEGKARGQIEALEEFKDEMAEFARRRAKWFFANAEEPPKPLLN